MCGIHFVINADNYNNKLADYIRECFIANAVRGVHSSGVFQVKDTLTERKTHPVEYMKLPVNGTTFLENPSVKDIIRGASGELVTVGHVRHATSGGISMDNAHPFLYKRDNGSSIIGVHNGSLQQWRNHEDASKHNVDSSWMFQQIAEKGEDAFKLFDGAYALVWYDSEQPDRLFVARNDKRTLFWAHSKDKKCLLAASEMGMLQWLCDRNDIDLWQNDKGFRLFYPTEGLLYSIDINDPSQHETSVLPKLDSSLLRGPAYTGAYAPFQPTVITANSPRSTYGNTGSANTSQHTAPPSRQLMVLEGIKKVLKEARDKADNDARALVALGGGEEIITNEVLEENLHRALSDWQNKQTVAGCEFVDVIFSQKASAAEAAMAKEAGMLGLVVDFVGYFQDKEVQIVYGDFEVNVNGKKTAHDAMVRFVPSKLAEDKYINPTKTTKMFVVGMCEDYYLLDDLMQGAPTRTIAEKEVSVTN